MNPYRRPSLIAAALGFCLTLIGVTSAQEVLPDGVPEAFESDWDFYPDVIDGAHSSTFVDLGFADHLPLQDFPTRYTVTIQINQPGPHGMGSDREEVDRLNRFEDELYAKGSDAGLLPVGRIRHAGRWSISLMGPAGAEKALRNTAAGLETHTVEVSSQLDADWSFYRKHLLPSSERMQWIRNRRVVDILIENQDVLDTPRPIHHWLYFASEEALQQVQATTTDLGFEVERSGRDGDQPDPLPWVLVVHRNDPASLKHIHAVTRKLGELAEHAGGRYDGWETPVIRAEEAGPATQPD
ncbi:MAG: DUF695 domain-containing protein [Planctomycetota bacterium]